MPAMNLKTETAEEIEKAGLTPEQIIFIGSQITGHRCSWSEFCEMADREYDNGFGSPKVAQDLVIVFSCGKKLRREEYDGAEAWELLKPFSLPSDTHAIKSIFAEDRGFIGWVNLVELNPINATGTEGGENHD
jgi:hypothetical protein